MVGLLSLESYCGRPKMRNSVLEELRDRKLEDIPIFNSIVQQATYILYSIAIANAI